MIELLVGLDHVVIDPEAFPAGLRASDEALLRDVFIVRVGLPGFAVRMQSLGRRTVLMGEWMKCSGSACQVKRSTTSPGKWCSCPPDPKLAQLSTRAPISGCL